MDSPTAKGVHLFLPYFMKYFDTFYDFPYLGGFCMKKIDKKFGWYCFFAILILYWCPRVSALVCYPFVIVFCVLSAFLSFCGHLYHQRGESPSEAKKMSFLRLYG